MNTMLTVAELLAGEALISPGGPVDRLTAAADDYALFADRGAAAGEPSATLTGQTAAIGEPDAERVLLPV